MKCKNVIEYFAHREKSAELLLRKWNVLEELKTTLHLPYLTTVMLQNKDFTLSDFFGCLQIMDMKLNQIILSSNNQHTKLAENLQICLNQRKARLIENPIMMCALFLDPRFKCELDVNPDKRIFAKLTLEKIWQRFKSVKNSGRTNDEAVNIQTQNTSAENMNDLYAELDERYQSMGLSNAAGQSSLDNSFNFPRNTSAISVAVHHYEQFVSGIRMKSSESVHEFWEKNKTKFGLELYEIASIIFAVPPTQASVERSFSALKYMFIDYRYNLSEDLLECCLLIHLNPQFYYMVKDFDLKRIEENLRKNAKK